jgi:proteasome accessory factor B
MDRTERLLDLVALLLDAKEPISWAELRESFAEDYGSASDEAAERKFERDKAELLELGIPIAYVQGDDDRKDGYVVEKETYYLPEVGLSPEELAVLYAAGSAALASGAFPGSQDLAHALRKIGFFAGTELPTPRVRMELGAVHSAPELASRLEQLWSAAAARKFVDISYYSPRSGATTQRRVDPYGLALRRGLWSLVGWCHLRKGIRTFHVHRIRDLEANPARPRSADFEVPASFKLDDYVASYPWQHTFHEPIPVQLQLSGELAPLAAGLFPTARVEPRGAQTLALVSATDLDGLIKYVLSLGADCRVLGPAQAVKRWREMAERIVSAHAKRATQQAAGGT